MTYSPDYRKYIEQRFTDLTTLMNARFNTVDDDNESIKDHLKQLNGTVKEHTKQITDLKLSDELHISDCPAMPKIESIKEDLQEYHILKKYPKLVLLILAIVVSGLIISGIGTLKSISTNNASKDIKQSVDGISIELAPNRSANTHRDTIRVFR